MPYSFGEFAETVQTDSLRPPHERLRHLIALLLGQAKCHRVHVEGARGRREEEVGLALSAVKGNKLVVDPLRTRVLVGVERLVAPTQLCR